MRRPRVLGRATLPLLDVLLSPSLAAQASLDVVVEVPRPHPSGAPSRFTDRLLAGALSVQVQLLKAPTAASLLNQQPLRDARQPLADARW